MSSLNERDGMFHYSDGSHRWIAPPDVEQAVWNAELDAHQAAHRTTMGRPLRKQRCVGDEEIAAWDRSSSRAGYPRERTRTVVVYLPMTQGAS